jgi:Rrf2 family protein
MRLAEAWATGGTTTIPEVSRLEGISPQYTAKLVGLLRRAGLVRSERGVNGGIALARQPDAITLEEAFSALSGAPFRGAPCLVSGPGDCSRAGNCGLRDVLGTLQKIVRGLLSQVTLSDLVDVDALQERATRMEAESSTMWRPHARRELRTAERRSVTE